MGMEQMNGKCTACRQDYAEANFRYDATVSHRKVAKGKRKNQEKEKEKAPVAKKGAPQKEEKNEKSREQQELDMRAKHAEQLQQRKGRGGNRDLGQMRVVQRNVVHVIGLTQNIAKADVLKRPEFFGQYGNILRT